MEISQKLIHKYVTLYGADIENWPSHLRELGRDAVRIPVYAEIIDEEKRFEALLRTNTPSHASDKLAQRIMHAAHNVPQHSESLWQLGGALRGINPTALAAMVVLGFTIGFTSLTPDISTTTASLQSYIDDEGIL